MIITEELKRASEAELRERLKQANPMVLRGLVYQATQDPELRDRIRDRKEMVGWIEVPKVADDESFEILIDKTVALLMAYKDGSRSPPTEIDAEVVQAAMELTVGSKVPDNELVYWTEEAAFDPMVRRLKWKKPQPAGKVRDFKVAVIGIGVGGINTTVQLEAAGFDFTIYEKNAGIGGVWFQNRYPGARIDSPSRVYSNTWAVGFDFKHFFAPQAENEAFLNWCIDSRNLRSRIQFSTEVVSAEWQEPSQQWKITLRRGDGRMDVEFANAIITAVGFLDRPVIPAMPGADIFEGPQMHTATYDHSIDYSDKRVAVIGSGASGMQILPDLQPIVKHLTHFFRSPPWVLPAPGYREPLHDDVMWVERNVPYYRNWSRFALTWAVGDHTYGKFIYRDPNWTQEGSINEHHATLGGFLTKFLQESLGDRPDLYEKMLPDYMPLGKRFTLDYGFLDTMKQDNVNIVKGEIDHLTENGIVTADGVEHPIDAIIYATGFRASDYLWPMEITGRDGTPLSEVWAKDGARAFWGITIPRMPNLFCVYGPNTNPTNTGPVQWGEMQVRYILQCLEKIIDTSCGSIEVRQDVYEDFNVKLDHELSRMIYVNNGGKSYYTNEFGRAATNAPWPSFVYWTNLLAPNFDDYVLGCPQEAAVAAAVGD